MTVIDRGGKNVGYFSLTWPFAQKSEGETRFEHEAALLKAELANITAHINNEVSVRLLYQQRIQAFVADLRSKAAAGAISWGDAAREASTVRNVIMETMRGRSTPFGRALAESLKREGKTLNELIARKTLQIFGQSADFTKLTADQQGRVYQEIVKSAAKSNVRVDQAMRFLRPVGRSLIVLSLSISVYTIATAEDKVEAAKKEGATLGAGIAGGIAGGAAAGLMCGPGAPVCVGIGAFVGGALAAFGVSLAW
jgi:hypothetical protein